MGHLKAVPDLPGSPMRQTQSVVVSARTGDLFDALQRLLADAQRFGCKLTGAAAGQVDRSTATIRLTLEIGLEDELSALRARFARHPSIAGLEVTAVQTAIPGGA